MKPGEVGMLTEERIAEIRARCEAATDGPWVWRVKPESHIVQLLAARGWGDLVFEARRWGMNGATLCFVVDGLTETAQDLSVAIPGEEHHSSWDRTLEHPDAVFIAHARQDIPALLAALDEQAAEIARLRAVAEKCRSHIGTGNATVDFEAAAERFRRDTHMMAPGKSEAPGWNSRYTYDERQLAWQMWHEQQTSDIRAALAALTQEATDETR